VEAVEITKERIDHLAFTVALLELLQLEAFTFHQAGHAKFPRFGRGVLQPFEVLNCMGLPDI
jgi:hypothetical protein